MKALISITSVEVVSAAHARHHLTQHNTIATPKKQQHNTNQNNKNNKPGRVATGVKLSTRCAKLIFLIFNVSKYCGLCVASGRGVVAVVAVGVAGATAEEVVGEEEVAVGVGMRSEVGERDVGEGELEGETDGEAGEAANVVVVVGLSYLGSVGEALLLLLLSLLDVVVVVDGVVVVVVAVVRALSSPARRGCSTSLVTRGVVVLALDPGIFGMRNELETLLLRNSSQISKSLSAREILDVQSNK